MVAARYLARREFPEFAPAVLKRLHRFEGWNRRFLASMLAEMGPEASPTLREKLADQNEPAWLRAVHAEALGMQLDLLAGDVAVEVLGTAEDRDLIVANLHLLAAVGRPDHLPVIRERCAVSDVVIRAQALHALGLLGDTEDVPLLLRGHGRSVAVGRDARRAGRSRSGWGANSCGDRRVEPPERRVGQADPFRGGRRVSETFWAVIRVFNYIVLFYFVVLNLVYLCTSFFAFGALRRYSLRMKSLDLTDLITSAWAPPITLMKRRRVWSRCAPS
jgi:hypothetical protein